MTDPAPLPQDDRALPWPTRWDLPLVMILGVLLLWALMPGLGVWEPWEADHAGVAQLMRESGQWLEVRVPLSGDRVRAVPELAFGWWPIAATTALLGVGELGLRLPGLLAGLGVLALLVVVVRRFFGRLAGVLSGLALLGMPLFAFHTRLALGSGLGMAFMALGALAFLRVAAADDEKLGAWWIWGAWLATAVAGLVMGAVGLLAPILAGLATVATRRADPGGDRASALRASARRIAPLAPVLVALALVGVGWWRALAHLDEAHSWTALLLWADPLGAPPTAAQRPFFDAFVHQIGFGLFPIGALLPFAFADLLWAPARDDEPSAAARVAPGLAAWFAVAFLGPALGAPEGQFALFLGAPAVAVAAGVYLARVVRTPPQPLLVIGAVLVLALLDSDLKHGTHFLADTLVGEAVDEFPDQLAAWSYELRFAIGGFKVDTTLTLARGFSFALLGLLMVRQGGLHRWLTPTVRALAYPVQRRHPWFDAWIAAPTLLPPIIVFARGGDTLDRLINAPLLNRVGLKLGVRKVALFLVIWLIGYAVLWALRAWRARRAGPTRDGRLTRASDRLTRFLDRPRVPRLGFVLILSAWALFLNVFVAHALTTNFSQKQIIHRYHELADPEEPLFTYRLDLRNSSFYARDLPTLDRAVFIERAKADEARFFAIVPRAQLSTINTEFRKATGNTLPVLDDSGHRFRLVSNRVDEGEVDRNPIKRALVDAISPDATAVSVNFEDKIELVGWMFDPPVPRAGSPLTISLFWKALAPNVGDWKVFVHIDAPGERIHGDHDPVEGLFPTSDWREGDLIRDDHRLVVKRGISPNLYTVYAGLYRGNTRMKITKGAKDREDRARLGTAKVR